MAMTPCLPRTLGRSWLAHFDVLCREAACSGRALDEFSLRDELRVRDLASNAVQEHVATLLRVVEPERVDPLEGHEARHDPRDRELRAARVDLEHDHRVTVPGVVLDQLFGAVVSELVEINTRHAVLEILRIGEPHETPFLYP